MELLLSHQTQFVSIYSQTYRKTDPLVLMNSLQTLIVSLRKTIMTTQIASIQKAHFTILKLLFKLIVYTRDINGGLGERNLTYYMLFIWKYHFPLPTAYCLSKMVSHSSSPSIGSWRDIKGYCEVIKKYSEKGEQDPFIETCIGLMNHQLHDDMVTWNCAINSYTRRDTASISSPIPSKIGISLVCKWIPRETSAHSWLFDLCAVQWIRAFRPKYFKTVGHCNERLRKAILKGKREYRRVFTELSVACDTLEIKQCANKWESIDPKHIPMRAMATHQRSLLNIGNMGNVRFKTANNAERAICATRIQLWWARLRSNKEKRPIFIEMGTIIKQSLRAKHPSEIYRTETLWSNVLNQLPEMPRGMIPVLDTSLFHTDPDSFYHALGMAMIMSCKSPREQKQLVVFDITAQIVSLSGNLQQMMEVIKPIFKEHHIGSDMKHAFTTILSSVPISVDDVLVIFSSNNNNNKSLVDAMCVFGNEPPSVLLWSEIGIYGTDLLKAFPIFVGYGNETLRHIAMMPAMKQLTPFVFIQYLLGNSRYDLFDAYFDSMLRKNVE